MKRLLETLVIVCSAVLLLELMVFIATIAVGGFVLFARYMLS